MVTEREQLRAQIDIAWHNVMQYRAELELLAGVAKENNATAVTLPAAKPRFRFESVKTIPVGNEADRNVFNFKPVPAVKRVETVLDMVPQKHHDLDDLILLYQQEGKKILELQVLNLPFNESRPLKDDYRQLAMLILERPCTVRPFMTVLIGGFGKAARE